MSRVTEKAFLVLKTSFEISFATLWAFRFKKRCSCRSTKPAWRNVRSHSFSKYLNSDACWKLFPFYHSAKLFSATNIDCHQQSVRWEHKQNNKKKLEICWHYFSISTIPFTGHYCAYIIYEQSFWFWSAWQLAVKLAVLVYWWHVHQMVSDLCMALNVFCSFLRRQHQRRFYFASLKSEKANQVRGLYESLIVFLAAIKLVSPKKKRLINKSSIILTANHQGVQSRSSSKPRSKTCTWLQRVATTEMVTRLIGDNEKCTHTLRCEMLINFL